MNKVFVCIDDTDNLESIGTGTVADYIKERINEKLNLEGSMTTRHQLLIHEDIPYTSHNSSMCFVIDKLPDEMDIKAIVDIAKDTVVEFMAEGSDPGLCVAYKLNEINKSKIISFGRHAKKIVLTKDMAYSLAQECGLHLSEHGGSGAGIIGALAGVGLRLSGMDGEVKGGLKQVDSGTYSVVDLLKRKDIDRIIDLDRDKTVISGHVNFITRTKPVYRNFEFVLFVKKSEVNLDEYNVYSKKTIRQLESNYKIGLESVIDCEFFKRDVEEECIDEGISCDNCVYRRWIHNSRMCMKGVK